MKNINFIIYHYINEISEFVFLQIKVNGLLPLTLFIIIHDYLLRHSSILLSPRPLSPYN